MIFGTAPHIPAKEPAAGRAARAFLFGVVAFSVTVAACVLAGCAHRGAPTPAPAGSPGSSGSPGSPPSDAPSSAASPGPALETEPLVAVTRSSLKQARRGIHEGRMIDAFRIYRAILETTPREDPRRPEALYWVGMLELSSDPALNNVEKGRGLLRGLIAAYPGWERSFEASLALGLLDRLDAERALGEAAEARRAEAALATETCVKEKVEMSASLDGAQAEIKSLQTQVSARRAEADGLREDLRRKDEALKKVKEAVVGWKPSR